MKQFWEWVINIGYTEKEIDTLSKNHIEILMKEFSDLLVEQNKRSKIK